MPARRAVKENALKDGFGSLSYHDFGSIPAPWRSLRIELASEPPVPLRCVTKMLLDPERGAFRKYYADIQLEALLLGRPL